MDFWEKCLKFFIFPSMLSLHIGLPTFNINTVSISLRFSKLCKETVKKFLGVIMEGAGRGAGGPVCLI